MRSIVIVILICSSLQVFSQSSRVEEINSFISNIFSICAGNNSICSKTIKKGYASSINRFTGLPTYKNKGGEYFENSLFYNDIIYCFNQAFEYELEGGGKWQTEENYYFIDKQLVKYTNIDTLINNTNLNNKLNHKLILYFNNDHIIRYESQIHDRYKVTYKEISKIINFSKQLTIIRIL